MQKIKSLAVTIKRPVAKRATFAFVTDIKFTDKTRSQAPTKLNEAEAEALKQINDEFERGSDLEKCTRLAKKLKDRVRERLQREAKLVTKLVFNSDNYEILDAFFDSKYKSKITKDKTNAKNDFRRAVDAIGEVSLRIGTAEEIQDKLAKLKDSNKQRRAVSRLRQILKYLGRDLILEKDGKKPISIRYLNEKEFQLVLERVQDPFEKLLYRGLFYSGCRIGELFALEDDDYESGILNVDKQMLRKSEVKKRNLKGWRVPTKTSEARRVVVTKEFDAVFRLWANISIEEKLKRRDEKWAQKLKSICQRVFPSKEHKHCVVHDLRHSFAKNMLAMGANITAIAANLGNSVAVCQEHYAGKFHSDESIDFLKRLLR